LTKLEGTSPDVPRKEFFGSAGALPSRKKPFAIRHSPFTIRYSPFANRRRFGSAGASLSQNFAD
jgi:hypothetical protein